MTKHPRPAREHLQGGVKDEARPGSPGIALGPWLAPPSPGPSSPCTSSARHRRRPDSCPARSPEAAEALGVLVEEGAQVELRGVLAVPLQQLLELRVLGERGHGGSGGEHGHGGASPAGRKRGRAARRLLWRRRRRWPRP